MFGYGKTPQAAPPEGADPEVTASGGPSMIMDRESLLNSSVRLPEHVVFRTFVAETVVLNLNTGLYHGVNPVGGAMLEAVNSAGSVREAADAIAARYHQDPATVMADMVTFCADLLERGLIEVVDPATAS